MIKPVDYKQTDSRWAYHDYSVKGKEKTNILESGCGPVCAAMVIASLKDSSVTPVTCADWAVKNGYKAVGAGTYNSYFVPQLKTYGIKAEYLGDYAYHNLNHPSHAKVKAALQAGNWVIANAGVGRWTKSGHFILVYSIDKEDNIYYVHINDPASSAANRLKAKFDDFAYEMKYYCIITVDQSAKPAEPAAKQHLSYGDNNREVGVAERILSYLGFYKGAIDNSFGSQLLSAVKAFQKAYGLEVDGLYGPKTKAKAESIYNAAVAANNTASYTVGKVYKLVYDRNVRSGPGINYSQFKRTQLTADGQKHAYSQTYAALKVGTQVTVMEVRKVSNSEIWLRIPSGWIAGVYNGCKCVK